MAGGPQFGDDPPGITGAEFGEPDGLFRGGINGVVGVVRRDIVSDYNQCSSSAWGVRKWSSLESPRRAQRPNR